MRQNYHRHHRTGEKAGSQRLSNWSTFSLSVIVGEPESRFTWQRPGVNVPLIWSPAYTPGSCSKRVSLEASNEILTVWAPGRHPHLLVKSPPAEVFLQWWRTMTPSGRFGVLRSTGVPLPRPRRALSNLRFQKRLLASQHRHRWPASLNLSWLSIRVHIPTNFSLN